MTFRIFISFFLLIGLSACGRKNLAHNRYFNVDSLISRQVEHLTVKSPSVTKTITINNLEEALVIKPDSASWAHELGIFRYLDILNKPIYATAYTLADGVKDNHSNLTLRIYRPTQPVPIREFKLYYQDSFEKIRRIEATMEESNSLYFSRRNFVLTFDDRPEKAALQSYAVNGFQKMIMGDTVWFSLSARLVY